MGKKPLCHHFVKYSRNNVLPAHEVSFLLESNWSGEFSFGSKYSFLLLCLVLIASETPQFVLCGTSEAPELQEVRHFAAWTNNLYLHLGYMEIHYMLQCHVFPWILPGSCYFSKRVIKKMSSCFQQAILGLLVTLSVWLASGIFHREKPFQERICQHIWEVQIKMLRWWRCKKRKGWRRADGKRGKMTARSTHEPSILMWRKGHDGEQGECGGVREHRYMNRQWGGHTSQGRGAKGDLEHTNKWKCVFLCAVMTPVGDNYWVEKFISRLRIYIRGFLKMSEMKDPECC